MTQQNYTFGDGNRASERLALLAEAFEPSLHAFLTRELSGRTPDPGLVLDLGCGPGHTTRVLALRPFGQPPHGPSPHDEPPSPRRRGVGRVIGLDLSEAFLKDARARSSEQVTFLRHDVCETPFPTGPADVVYSRFLLTHLAEPAEIVRRWASVLAPGGRLLLQEMAVLESSHPTLARYYELVARLQRHYGQALHVGGALEGFAACPELRVLDFRLTDPGVSAATMAELHRRNLPTWRRDPFAREAFDPRELDELELGLAAIAEGRDRATVRLALGELSAERLPRVATGHPA